jgi:hypothetical protein
VDLEVDEVVVPVVEKEVGVVEEPVEGWEEDGEVVQEGEMGEDVVGEQVED